MKEKIIIVDDIYANRFLLEQCLSEYDLQSASSSEMLFKFLEKQIPDLIILDIGLPDEDGFSIAKKLEKDVKFRDIPVIFVTAHTSKKEVIQGFISGGYDYIIKPFDNDLLLERVKKVLDIKKRERLKKLST
jgi:putative two-component system response regulator